MKLPFALALRWVLWLALLSMTMAGQGAPQVDDRIVHVSSATAVAEKRAALVHYLWGSSGLPGARVPSLVRTNVDSPVHALRGLARVDELRFNLAPGLEALAYHFVPEIPRQELVIVHHGHACTLDDAAGDGDVGFGLQRTIDALLGAGYGVLGVFMPHMRPGDCSGNHDALCAEKVAGSPIKFFLEPTVLGLNYLGASWQRDRFPRYERFHMTGLSGGGWTTTLCAAIDPRIQKSFPIAGTLPLYLRAGGSIGDREQYEESHYTLAGYPDLYVLGASGPGRAQVQIVLRHDDCCFGEAQHDAKAVGLPYAAALRECEGRVGAALQRTGAGAYRLEIDETAPSHMISHHAIRDILLPELRRGEPESIERRRRGLEFLVRLFDRSVDLLPEFRGSTNYWLYHDNYLAAHVLAEARPDLTERIRAALRRHGVTRSGKIEIVLDEARDPLPFRAYQLREVTAIDGKSLRTEDVTPRPLVGWEEYADLLLMAAMARRVEAPSEAKELLARAERLWDGQGFKDRAATHHGIYATYKLALYLMATARLGTAPALAEPVRARLWAQQGPEGGWITDYDAHGPKGLANVETTSLALLALRAAPAPRAGSGVGAPTSVGRNAPATP